MSINGGSTTVLAGQTSNGFVNGQGTAAMFNNARGLVIHPVTGVIYITDANNNRIRTCTPSGYVSTLTGNGGSYPTNVGNVDGSSSVATFYGPAGIVMDSTSSNLYVTCANANTLRKLVLSTVYTTTIVSSGTFTYPRYVSDDYYIWSI